MSRDHLDRKPPDRRPSVDHLSRIHLTTSTEIAQWLKTAPTGRWLTR